MKQWNRELSMGHKSLNEDPVMIFLYNVTNNKEQQQQQQNRWCHLRKMPRNTANSSFHFQNAAFKPLVKKRKIDLKQLRYFANNWFSSWLQLSREASFSPAVGKSVFVVERQLALIGEIAISCLGSFNLFLFLYSCTLYRMSQKSHFLNFWT